MATGVLGILNGVGSITYTANANAKIKIAGLSSYTYTIAIQGIALTSGVGSPIADFYIGAGQVVTITSGASNSGVISILEEL